MKVKLFVALLIKRNDFGKVSKKINNHHIDKNLLEDPHKSK